MDHDRLFKELISNFFVDFIELFLPDVSEYLDRDAVMVPMDKEVFTDVTIGDKHAVDLVMKVKFRSEDAFFLVHVENQARSETDFPKRMFRYFARLTETYDLPVYPVVIFSHDKPKRQEPTQYRVAFPGNIVLRFNYKVVQLNRLPWRRFVNKPNPVASALMSKMQMAPGERPKVKIECLRLLASLKLDPARSKLIGGFIDSYLELTAAEMEKYERELAQLGPGEKEATMELMSSWEKRGLEKGRQEGKEEMLGIVLENRFSTLPRRITERLDSLSSDDLDALGREIFNFSSLTDLEQWLNRH